MKDSREVTMTNSKQNFPCPTCDIIINNLLYYYDYIYYNLMGHRCPFHRSSKIGEANKHANSYY